MMFLGGVSTSTPANAGHGRRLHIHDRVKDCTWKRRLGVLGARKPGFRVGSSMPMSRADSRAIVIGAEQGDEGAAQRLSAVLYEQLRGMAAAALGGPHSRRHTLQPTALVHEAWLRLVDEDTGDLRQRERFLSLFAAKLRHVLVDCARERARLKRGGDRKRVPLVEVADTTANRVFDVLALEEALSDLERIDARRARLVELRFFAGLTWGEAARAAGIPERTADLRWRSTRAWLEKRLRGV